MCNYIRYSLFLIYFDKYNLKRIKSKIIRYFFVNYCIVKKNDYLCGVKIITMIKYIKRKLKRRAVRKKLLEFQIIYDIVDPGRLADMKDCMFIFRNTLKHPNSVYEIAPLSSHRIIENKKLGVFVVLDDKKITIINHVCYYSNISMTDRDWKKMVRMFDNRVQENRMRRIDQMKSQVEHSLSKLKNKILLKSKTPTIE